MALYIGLMSGTSLDGVDAVLVEFEEGRSALPMQVRGHAHTAFEAALRQSLGSLNRSGADELHRSSMAANAVALAYADTVQRLLTEAGVPAAVVRAIGAHGQTVRHRPGEFDGNGYTVQLLNAALLAERTGIDVVCDFRSRDVAAGGQGAPLVPAFHAECFGVRDRSIAVLNLGGIANLTLLPPDGAARGFDCGPANTLMDGWCQRHLGAAFDRDGAWAATGTVSSALLTSLLAEAFFGQPPPKSTGLDLFNLDWLEARLAPFPHVAACDVMATLAELTARSAVEALQRQQPGTETLLVSGGGAFNGHLMRRLAALQPAVITRSSASAGVPPDQVEALAFAWLARAFIQRTAGNLPAVTGAAGPRILGALYPGEGPGR